MHLIAQIVTFIASPLLWLAHAFMPALADADHRQPMGSDFTVAAFAVSTAVIGTLCSIWAAWMHARLGNFKIDLRTNREATRSDLALRDAVMAESGQSIVIMGEDLKTPLTYGNGASLLETVLAGRDAPVLAAALSGLLHALTPFEMSVRSSSGRRIAVTGRPVRGRSVLYLRDLFADDPEVDYRALASALPVPVWVRGPDLQLRWANAAYLALAGTDAVRGNVALDRSEFDLASAARDGTDVLNARRYVTARGERRALSMSLSRLPDSSIAASAIDVTDAVRTEGRLQIAADANANMLDRIDLAIAVFDNDQHLAGNNRCFARMWSFPQDWLDTHPTHEEILDRLRESRLLPEQRDFAAWKKQRLEPKANGAQLSEEFWHMPSGRSLRVVGRPHLQGGTFYTFEDVSETLSLKAALATLGAVQKVTLDTIEDPVAIFETDGRLTQSNQAFARLWHLSAEELADAPHFTALAALCMSRFGRDNIWDIVSSAIASQSPERYGEWGNIARSDGRLISLAPTRLPNGATLVCFRDVTDLERFRAFQKETTYHAA